MGSWNPLKHLWNWSEHSVFPLKPGLFEATARGSEITRSASFHSACFALMIHTPSFFTLTLTCFHLQTHKPTQTWGSWHACINTWSMTDHLSVMSVASLQRQILPYSFSEFTVRKGILHLLIWDIVWLWMKHLVIHKLGVVDVADIYCSFCQGGNGMELAPWQLSHPEWGNTVTLRCKLGYAYLQQPRGELRWPMNRCQQSLCTGSICRATTICWLCTHTINKLSVRVSVLFGCLFVFKEKGHICVNATLFFFLQRKQEDLIPLRVCDKNSKVICSCWQLPVTDHKPGLWL